MVDQLVEGKVSLSSTIRERLFERAYFEVTAIDAILEDQSDDIPLTGSKTMA